ncbi:MAG TPA: 2-phospho-L-lactate guanylyltransferase [Mycobacteriales bacterium]|nr:2-phospho-L-lactate guanylyltransferase [Mycobacteriales bacterium]
MTADEHIAFARWSLVVPVKRLHLAKSRLALAPQLRAEVALAMALDTVAAALRCGRAEEVIAVTDDERAAQALSELGARVVADVPDAGLNPALSHGVASAGQDHVGALASDLPALRPDELDEVLAAAEAHDVAAVADRAGAGTTLLTARRREAFVPAFGAGSFAAHLRAGAADLTASAGATVRLDVDTVDALAAATQLGVGPATARVCEGLAAAERG